MFTSARILLCVLLMGALLPLSADISFTLGGSNCPPAGICTSVVGATTIDFDGELGTLTPYTSGLARYTWSGGGSPFVSGSAASYAAPPGDATTYLTVGSTSPLPSTVSIDFSQPLRYFGFYMGSPDLYNIVVLKDGVEIKVWDETDFYSGANGNQTIGRYVNFFATNGQSFDQVIMTSTQAAFETDNHAYAAVPEPASILGLGTILFLLGSRLRRRRA